MSGQKTTLFEVYITENSTESCNLRYIKAGSVCSCKSSTAEKSTQPFNTDLFRTTLKSEFHTEICTYKKKSTLFLQKGQSEIPPIFILWQPFTCGINQHTSKILPHFQSPLSSHTCITHQTITPRLIVHCQIYVRLQSRTVIEFLDAKGKKQTCIHERWVRVYGKTPVDTSTVQRCVRRIKVAATGRAALMTYSGVVALALQQCMTTSVGLRDR
jgi:hypothetical protein